MYLLHAVHQGSLLAASDQSNTQTQRREFQERWHVLKQYKCDPWQEIETFEHKLQRPPATTADVTERPGFDIGRSIRTHHMGGWNNEALTAYNFLRFVEDAGLPFQVPGCVIATKSADRNVVAHRGLFLLLGIGNPSTNRRRQSSRRDLRPTVSCGNEDAGRRQPHRALPGVASRRRFGHRNGGSAGAAKISVRCWQRILPEILSRLCCKCSSAAREKLLDWLLEVYRSEHRSNYQGIRQSRTTTPRLLSE